MQNYMSMIFLVKNDYFYEITMRIMSYSKKNLIYLLKEFAQKNGWYVTRKLVDSDESMPSSMAYRKHFWSWSLALRYCDIEVQKYIPKYTKRWKSKKWVSRIKNHNWYIQIYKPEHICSSKNWYVLEHRMIVADSIWRKLSSKEVVHHINWIKDDNRIENLELMARWEHTTHHHKWVEKNKKRKLSCTFPWCTEKTTSKKLLCNYHYRLQRSRIKKWLISDYSEFYVLVNSSWNKRGLK